MANFGSKSWKATDRQRTALDHRTAMTIPMSPEKPRPDDSHDHGGKGHDDLDDIIRKTLPQPAREPAPDTDKPKNDARDSWPWPSVRFTEFDKDY